MRKPFNHLTHPTRITTHDTETLRTYTATPAAALIMHKDMAALVEADTLRLDESGLDNAFTYLSNLTLRALRQELSDRGRVVRDGRVFTAPGEMQYLLRTSVLPLSLAEIIPQGYDLRPQGARVLVAVMRQRGLDVPEWLATQAKKMPAYTPNQDVSPL